MRHLLIAALLLMAGCADDSSNDPTVEDSDGDGFTDAFEEEVGTDPRNATSKPTAQRESEGVTFSETGLIVLGVEDPTGPGCGQVSPMGVASFTWTITAPGNVSKPRVADMTFTATYPPTMPEGDIYVFDPDGNQITDSTGAEIPPGDPTAITDTVTAPGPYAPGEYRIEVRGCAGAGEVSLDAEATLSYVPEDPRFV